MVKRARNIYEAMMGGGKPPSKESKGKRSTPTKRKKQTKTQIGGRESGFGDRQIALTVTPNILLGVLLLVVVLLASMYGLGRYHGGGTVQAAEKGINEIRMPAKPDKVLDSQKEPEKVEVPALCVAYYASLENGKVPASRLANWLKEQGFEGTKIVPYQQKAWFVAIPFGQLTQRELKDRVGKLKSPPFHKDFRFSDRVKKMYEVTLQITK